MKTSKLILWGLICMIAAMPAFAQSRSEKKARIERAVKEAVDAKTYEINVDRMHPIKGGSRTLTTNYSLKVRNDSVYSYLPYFGVAYSVPYGGGKGMIFNEPLTDYTTKKLKKGKVQVAFQTRSEGDNYEYSLTIYPNGSTTINVQATNRQSISYTGEMDIKE
ncbi:DUF4251 domain-containing protein [uncultured Bacteroides sp.]|uniref:DUF4251 domain-containing protein n=1 Tax=uncultured Bacteroides sp. TaxID=162156 RepID=UPI002618EA49|nr:DUF4251 domain-containing protein [uncultured Bacteroides sp.]